MTWGDYFIRIARAIATKSRDPSTQVGAVLVDEDRVIRATGYNGLPRGVRDLPERLQRPAKYIWTSHAEMNTIAHAARVGVPTKGCTLIVTHEPCAMCARLILQAGISHLIIGTGTTSMPAEEFEVSRTMLEEAGVNVCFVSEEP